MRTRFPPAFCTGSAFSLYTSAESPGSGLVAEPGLSGVIGNGEIEIISDFEEKKKGLDVIMAQHGKKKNTYNEKLVNRVVILKLYIKSVTGKQS